MPLRLFDITLILQRRECCERRETDPPPSTTILINSAALELPISEVRSHAQMGDVRGIDASEKVAKVGLDISSRLGIAASTLMTK
jgi:hypothetical protein